MELFSDICMWVMDISVCVVSVSNSSYSIIRIRLTNEFKNRNSKVLIWWQIRIQWSQKHDMTNFIKFRTFLTIVDAILNSQSWILKIWQQIPIQRSQKHNNVRFHLTFLLFFESRSAILDLLFWILKI